MNVKLRLWKALGVVAVGLALLNCSGKKNDDPNHIKVGVSSGPELTIAKVAQKVAKE